MTGPLQVTSAEPMTLALVLVVAILLLVALLGLARRVGGDRAPESDAEEPMRADAPRGRVCPDCREVNPMDATECEACGRPFADPPPSEA